MGDPKKYKVIAKVGNLPDGKAKCVKYRVTNLVKFTVFLDHQFPDWRWFNVYDNKTGQQIASYTRNNRPSNRHATHQSI
jgi:hypothetical protein